MADNHPTAEGSASASGSGSGASDVAAESSDSVVQLNVKMLDSRMYSFHVDKYMPVLAFKVKIAAEVGLPVAQQRLIFRGKVLKDEDLLSEYHVENGHTLHLVERQATQPQPSAGTSSAETNTNNGSDGNYGVPRNRIGQISHSVVLGTINVGEQGEGGHPDLNRVIGAVLNSFGLGGQPATTGTGNTQSSAFPNGSGQVLQGDGPQGTHVNAAQDQTGSQTGNRPHSRNTFFSQQFPPMTQAMRVPLTAEVPPIPSLFTPVPDSLSTMLEFMNHMAQALSQTGSQTNTPPLPTVEVPSNAHGLPTPEALSNVLRQAERLLSDHAIPAISNLAGRLDQDGASTDVTTMGQVHTLTMQMGLAVQQMGALFLELGRTLLTLRTGRSPTGLFVNAGPAVYISSNRPNPMMVQPFPLQTSPIFGASVIPSGNPLSGGAGSVPRSINIHIHAGNTASPVVSGVGARAGNGEGSQGTNTGRNSSVDSGSTGVPSVNASAAAIPTHPTAVAAQPGVDVSISQPPPDQDSISAMVAEINSRIRTLVEETRAENQTPELDPRLGEAEILTTQDSHIAAEAGNEVGNNQLNNISMSDALGINMPVPGGIPQREDQKTEGHQNDNNKDALGLSSLKEASTCSSESRTRSIGETSEKLSDISDKSEATQAVPLGLGLGGLQPKAKSRQLKRSDGGASTADPNQETRTSEQQVSQSFASQSPVPIWSDADRGQSPTVQIDPANIMSQVLQSPALNGLLAGVSDQTGVGSPDMLRNMLGQISQSPMMRNAVNQIAQQAESEDFGSMLSGLGGGQGGGGFDLSRMLQQMMPIVSRALSGGSTIQEPFPAAETIPQPQYNDRMPSRDTPQIDLQHAAQRIARQDPPSDIFRAVAENAFIEYGDNIDDAAWDLVEELSNDEDLVREFMHMLVRHVLRRLEDVS